MKYKLLALDIDDTLVNSKHEVSDVNIKAIAKAKDAGVTVTVVTGRAYIPTKTVCAKIGLDDIPVITHGGAQIVNYPSDEIINRRNMPPDAVREILEFAFEHGIHAQIYDGDIFCFQEKREESDFYASRLGYEGRVMDLKNTEIDMSTKVLFTVDQDKMDWLKKATSERFGNKYRIVQSFARFLEFFMPGVDKGAGIKWLTDNLSLKKEEVLSMGDSGIDVAMFRESGLSVAVANATQECKDAADIITVSADDDAVAKIIYEYIL